MTITAHAKINLGLEVLYRRPDGYHEINTVFLPISLADTIEIQAHTGEFLLDTEPDLGIAPDDNLVVRAAKALRARRPGGQTAKIRLRKQIPSGAGLGGGSSDAAATLLALEQLWELPKEPALLHDIASSLGSDVPFFLLGSRAASARGRGEILEPASFPFPWIILLLCPGIHVSTPWAYRAMKRDSQVRNGRDFVSVLRMGAVRPELLREGIVNEFEDVVFSEYPLLRELKQDLYARGAELALMSGSGSTMFGLFRDADAARRAAHAFTGLRTELCSAAISTE